MASLKHISACLAIAAVAGFAWAAYDDQSILDTDHPAIQYGEPALADPVSKLDQQLAAGKTKLEYRDGFGYLPSVLQHLKVNPDSQILVFSKTSFQAPKISPRAPRALYFNDTVSVGSVREGDVLEFASLDPKQGVIFYTLDAKKADKPRFDRRSTCLQCHLGPATSGVPGIMVTSVFPDSTGMPSFKAGMPVTDHRTPFQERWGGWYVNGTHGGQHHRGNAVARDRDFPNVLETANTQNLTTLGKKVDTSVYLGPVSDIVALMTLEHQTRMTNLMTRVAWQWRMAEHDAKLPNPQIDAGIESLVTYMLFADEARLYEKVEGVSTFTKSFAALGPRDKQGRSLRDFDLEKRLFRYPLSFMIYSDAFDQMPADLRARIFQRLFDILTEADKDPKFAKLSTDDKRAVLEILRETKTLPEYWASK